MAGEFGAGVTTGTRIRAKVGSLAESDVRATHAIGNMTAGAARDSRIFSGVAPGLTVLPDSADDFSNPAAFIRNVSVKGTFGNTLVAAVTPSGVLRRARLDDPAGSVLEQDFAVRVI